MSMSAIHFSEKKSRIDQLFFDRQKRKPIKVLKLYHVVSTNAIFVVAQRGFSAQVEIKIQSNLSIADTCGSWKKCPLLPGVRYIEVFNISRRKGKKDTLMHNNVLNIINTVTGKRVTRGAGLGLEKRMDYTFYGDARCGTLVGKSIQENN